MPCIICLGLWPLAILHVLFCLNSQSFSRLSPIFGRLSRNNDFIKIDVWCINILRKKMGIFMGFLSASPFNYLLVKWETQPPIMTGTDHSIYWIQMSSFLFIPTPNEISEFKSFKNIHKHHVNYVGN